MKTDKALWRGHLWPRDHNLNNLDKGPLGDTTIKYLSSRLCGFWGEDVFVNCSRRTRLPPHNTSPARWAKNLHNFKLTDVHVFQLSCTQGALIEIYRKAALCSMTVIQKAARFHLSLASSYLCRWCSARGSPPGRRRTVRHSGRWPAYTRTGWTGQQIPRTAEIPQS